MGNTRSVLNAFNLLGEKCIITNKKSDITNSEVIVLPGVGAFSDGMTNIRQNGLLEILNEEVIDKKKPYLGICLGLEFLAKNSLEGGFCKEENKVPHMGWNDTKVILNDGIYSGITEPSFYYLHSYYLHLENQDKQYISGECSYGNSIITSSIEKDNIFAVQFHPEKSQSTGIKLLQNFLMRVRENAKE